MTRTVLGDEMLVGECGLTHDLTVRFGSLTLIHGNCQDS